MVSGLSGTVMGTGGGSSDLTMAGWLASTGSNHGTLTEILNAAVTIKGMRLSPNKGKMAITYIDGSSNLVLLVCNVVAGSKTFDTITASPVSVALAAVLDNNTNVGHPVWSGNAIVCVSYNDNAFQPVVKSYTMDGNNALTLADTETVTGAITNNSTAETAMECWQGSGRLALVYQDVSDDAYVLGISCHASTGALTADAAAVAVDTGVSGTVIKFLAYDTVSDEIVLSYNYSTTYKMGVLVDASTTVTVSTLTTYSGADGGEAQTGFAYDSKCMFSICSNAQSTRMPPGLIDFTGSTINATAENSGTGFGIVGLHASQDSRGATLGGITGGGGFNWAAFTEVGNESVEAYNLIFLGISPDDVENYCVMRILSNQTNDIQAIDAVDEETLIILVDDNSKIEARFLCA
jgi:hypothetical protein